jgi:hypothetical protein
VSSCSNRYLHNWILWLVTSLVHLFLSYI